MNQLIKPGAITLLLATQALLLACGQNGERPAQSVAIQIGKPSPLAAKIRECSNSKITPQTMVYRAKTDAMTCRLDAEGKAKDVGIRPSFQIRAESIGDIEKTKSRRIVIRQLLAFYSPESEGAKATPESLKQEGFASEVLNQSCAPIVKQILGRSGLTAKIGFRAFRETDRLDNSVVSTGDDDFDELRTPVSDKAEDKLSEKAVAKKTLVRAESGNAIHAMLPLRFDSEKGLSIHDELQPVWSGLTREATTVEPFCAQVAMRVLEGFGVVGGRDCACRLGQESCKDLADDSGSAGAGDSGKGEKSGAKKNSRPGVTKMTDPSEIVKSGRLNGSEVKQVLEPICGSFDEGGKK
ncbi:MAG: hypothetical protein JNJ49_01170 [Bdellovibrionaceae bacterium]|nr:hypothetical protein [Pseudobdellovibrionaceae bacterium]